MAKRFEVAATGLSGVPYRVDIYLDGYSSSVDSLTADNNFLVIEGGTNEWQPTDVVWAKEARLFLADDTDLSGIIRTQDKDVRMEVYRTDTSNLVFKGFVLTDLFEDDPYSFVPRVQLRAIDGLTLLKNQTLDSIYGANTTYVPYTDGIAEILAEVYPTALDVEFGVEWYPDEGTLSSSDCPLRYVGFDPNNYREDRPQGDWFSLWDTLRDLLTTHGCVLRQAQPSGESIIWQVRQRSAIDGNGDLKVWRFNPDGTEKSGQPITKNYETDLSNNEVGAEHTRSFERRWQSVTVEHDHAPLENIFQEPGFELQGSDWTLHGDADLDVSVRQHDNVAETPSGTQNNTYVLEVEEVNTADPAVVDLAASQNLGNVSGLPPRTYGNLSFAEDAQGALDLPRFALIVDNKWYLSRFAVNVRAAAEDGVGIIYVDGLDRPIPEGASLPFGPSGTANQKGQITLTERAEKGDEVLRGEITTEVASNWVVWYPGFVNSSSKIETRNWKFIFGYASYQWLFEWVDDSGNVLSGDVDFEIHARRDNSLGTAYFDDFSLTFARDGSELDTTAHKASIPVFGKDIAVSTRTNQGPSENNIARIRGFNPNNNSYSPRNWGLGAGAGSLTLEELHGREWLRYFRDWRTRLTLTFFSRGKAPVLSGHEQILWDGNDYTIGDIRYRPQQGEVQVDLLEKADDGTTNITFEKVLSEEEGGTTTGTSGTGALGSPGTSNNEISSFRPGPIAPDTEVFSSIVRHEWLINDLIIFATIAPASTGGYDFKVSVDGTTVKTVTLPTGTNQKEFAIDTTINPGELLEVRSENSTDSNLADVHCSFDLS